MSNIRPLPDPAPSIESSNPEPIVIHRWSVGYSKRTSERTLLLYRDMDFYGGLGGGGETLRYLPPARKNK